MIVLENVTKIYKTSKGRKRVLDDVSLVLPDGINVGILGRNGAGKSTLMRLLAQAEAPTKGRVIVTSRVSWPLAFGSGFQGSLTAVDNIRFVSRIYGEDWRKVVEEVESFAELGEYLHMPVRTLSSGMKARLCMALSLAIRFDVYLSDELHAVGDPRFKERFDRAFENLRRRASLILASHNAAVIEQHCDIALVLKNGKIGMYQDVGEALEMYKTA